MFGREQMWLLNEDEPPSEPNESRVFQPLGDGRALLPTGRMEGFELPAIGVRPEAIVYLALDVWRRRVSRLGRGG